MTYLCPHCNGTGSFSGVDPATVIFFGVWPGSRAGHFAYSRTADTFRSPIPFDGAETRPLAGNESYERQSPQIQGYARVTHHKGWTVVCCWDRTEDKRGASNAAFAAPGAVDPVELLRAAAIAFPRKWTQLEEAGGVRVKEVG